MVNYLYDVEDIEKNHEAYAEQRAIVAAADPQARPGAAGIGEGVGLFLRVEPQPGACEASVSKDGSTVRADPSRRPRRSSG